MAKKRKKSQKKVLQSVLSAVIVIILAIIAYFTEPWQYIDANDSGDKANISSAVEVDESRLAVYYIDVGQADSILIKLPTGENVLIDAGCENDATASEVSEYLDFITAQGVETIDYLFLTHPHFDHIGAADDVILSFEIENIILPDCDPLLWNNSSRANILDAMEQKNYTYDTCEPGTIYNIGEAVFTVLGPVGSLDNISDANDYSIVMRMVYGETSFMFTGDATESVEKDVIEKWGEDALECDVLKVGHHGSSTSSCKAFLEAVDPSLAVISCGEDNSYGHPTEKVLTRLAENTSATILRTDEIGTVIITSDGTTISLVTVETASSQ